MLYKCSTTCSVRRYSYHVDGYVVVIQWHATDSWSSTLPSRWHCGTRSLYSPTIIKYWSDFWKLYTLQLRRRSLSIGLLKQNLTPRLNIFRFLPKQKIHWQIKSPLRCICVYWPNIRVLKNNIFRKRETRGKWLRRRIIVSNDDEKKIGKSCQFIERCKKAISKTNKHKCFTMYSYYNGKRVGLRCSKALWRT